MRRNHRKNRSATNPLRTGQGQHLIGTGWPGFNLAGSRPSQGTDPKTGKCHAKVKQVTPEKEKGVLKDPFTAGKGDR